MQDTRAAEMRRWLDALSVRPGAGRAELDAALKRALIKWHPDRHPADREFAEAQYKFAQAAHAGLVAAGAEAADAAERRERDDRRARAGIYANAPKGGARALLQGVFVKTQV